MVLGDLLKNRQVQVSLRGTRWVYAFIGTAQIVTSPGDEIILLTDVTHLGKKANDMVIDTRSGGFMRMELLPEEAKK